MTDVPLVLLPGLLCDARVWAAQVAGLGPAGRCWVPDLTRDDTMAAMAGRVLEEVPFERFALAGFSMGGYLALELVRRCPERIDRLALLDTSARVDTPERVAERERFIALAQAPRGFAPITRAMLGFLVHPSRADDAELVGAIAGMAERTGAEAYVRQQRAILSRTDSLPFLAAIRCPTLVLCGRQDDRAPVSVHEELAAGIPGARLVVLEDCGHMAPMERPGEVTEALRQWLSAPAFRGSGSN